MIKYIDNMLKKSIVESSDSYLLKKNLIMTRNGFKKYFVTNNNMKRLKEKIFYLFIYFLI